MGSALQIIEGRRPTFVTRQIERTHSLPSIFHPDQLIRERHPTLQERRDSLQNDSLDYPSYIVDLHFRSLVKYRQESQIPLPAWRGPPKQERSHISLQDSPIHIQLPQLVTDTYKLGYISHQARGDSNSGEHSPADSQGVDIHPGPTLRKARSLEYLDVEAMGGPELREQSLAKFSGTTLPGPALSSKDSTAKKILLMEALIQGITQQQNLLGVLIVVLHIEPHIELHIKIILLVEALIQGIAQQHTQVA